MKHQKFQTTLALYEGLLGFLEQSYDSSEIYYRLKSERYNYEQPTRQGACAGQFHMQGQKWRAFISRQVVHSGYCELNGHVAQAHPSFDETKGIEVHIDR